EQYHKVRDYLATLDGMRQFVRVCLGETELEVDGEVYETVNVQQEYRGLFEDRRASLAGELAEAELTLRGLVRASAKLTCDVAIEVATQEIDDLSTRITELRQHLTQPLDERLVSIKAQLEQARDAIREAREAQAAGQGRRMAEALAALLSRAVLHFGKGPDGR